MGAQADCLQTVSQLIDDVQAIRADRPGRAENDDPASAGGSERFQSV
jgi:hypothetical protein